jgi:hypothetical protein
MTMMTITTDLSDHEFEAALDAAIETGNPDARVKVVEMYYESRMETAYAYQRATSADSRFEVTYADNLTALARAEAAEARAYQRLEDALFAEQRATDADIRAEETDADASRLRLELAAAKLGISALAARVAELEAQLAAQGWRPVTEKPVADDVAGCVPATATPVVWEAGRQ